ncbi:hypothetical protein SISNIDRAFT_456338 [Sistotremastrum niveocremeum HHB9708]|uniref:F-box domain-containing protein n=1 Tax=Sistotremastrum niveocremeum HHB9708 TaxID=1314777 RepID=A0A164SSC6_9AGAM|nr:hypothetical protein SISNIDRAFT_456338 [Sistotremastrum niveocremeum HHB9708]
MSGIPSVSELTELCQSFNKRVTEGIQKHMLQSRASFEGLSDIQHILIQMEQTLTESARLLRFQHNMCAPIGCLSNEIISEIMLICIQDLHADQDERNRDRGLSPQQNPQHSPLTLSPTFALCSRWRAIALHSPSLWSTIYLPWASNLLPVFLDRSGSLPLTIVVSNGHIFNSHDPELALARLAKDTCQLIPRLSNMELVWKSGSPESTGVDHFFQNLVGPIEFTLLKSLTVVDDTFHGGRSFAIDIPALQTFAYQGVTSSMPQCTRSSVVKLLLELQRCYMDPDSILNLLMEMPCLEDCNILDVKTVPRGGLSGRSVVALPRLKGLGLYTFTLTSMAYILEHIQMPASTTLALNTVGHPSDTVVLENFLGPYIRTCKELTIIEQQVETIYAFTEKSGREVHIRHSWFRERWGRIASLAKLSSFGCDLTVLDLEIKSFPQTPELIQALSTWTSITNIVVQTDAVAHLDTLFSVLERTPDVLCPLLQMVDCVGTPFHMKRVEKFLKFRNGVGLKELRLSSHLSDAKSKLEWHRFLGRVSSLSELILE